MKQIRILFADDHFGWRKSIIESLEDFNFIVCGEASNGKDLLKLMYLDPDLILLDLRMPVLDGNETFNIIREDYPEAKVVIISFFDEEMLVNDFKNRGAYAFISKEDCSNIPLLVEILRRCYDGKPFFYNGPRQRKRFSKSQTQIIPLIAAGETNKEIANVMKVQERAIEKRKQSLPFKVGGKTFRDFLQFAYTSGYQYLSRKKE